MARLRLLVSSIVDTESSDEALVFLSRDGDLDAFDEIVRRYQPRIAAYLRKFTPRQTELEDLTQETFIRAFKNLRQWRPSGAFSGWLLRIATNTAYDHFRRHRNEPIALAQRVDRDEEPTCVDRLQVEPVGPSEHPNAELLETILSQLPTTDRMVITLQYYEELPLQEIADRLQWGLSKTKVRSHRARTKLERILKTHGITGTF